MIRWAIRPDGRPAEYYAPKLFDSLADQARLLLSNWAMYAHKRIKASEDNGGSTPFPGDPGGLAYLQPIARRENELYIEGADTAYAILPPVGETGPGGYALGIPVGFSQRKDGLYIYARQDARTEARTWTKVDDGRPDGSYSQPLFTKAMDNVLGAYGVSIPGRPPSHYREHRYNQLPKT